MEIASLSAASFSAQEYANPQASVETEGTDVQALLRHLEQTSQQYWPLAHAQLQARNAANESPEVHSDDQSSSDDEPTFTTSGLPPSLLKIATSPEWLRLRSSSHDNLTGAKLLQDPDIFPGPSYSSPSSRHSHEPTEGRLLRCGPPPPSSLLSSSSHSSSP